MLSMNLDRRSMKPRQLGDGRAHGTRFAQRGHAELLGESGERFRDFGSAMTVAVGFDYSDDAGFVANGRAHRLRVMTQRGVIDLRPAAVRGHQERALRASMNDFTQRATKMRLRMAKDA